MKALFDSIASVVSLRKKFRIHCLALSGVLLSGLIFAVTATTISAAEYDASDVDKPPKLIRQTPIKFPSKAKKDGLTGKVVVRCLIGTNGRADRMEVVESEPVGVFDESAMSTLKYWQFRPGIKQGEIVATWVKVPFKFE
jgi:TonB family protein